MNKMNEFHNANNISVFGHIAKFYETIRHSDVSLPRSCYLSPSQYFTEISSMLPLIELMTENWQSSVVVGLLC